MFNNKKIHLIGIGGISMSSIALMLLNMNAQVSGSDIQESNLTKNLEEKGIKIKYGHHPEMVHDADIIVYTAAIHEDDPERIAIKNENKENYERAEFLGMMMLKEKMVILMETQRWVLCYNLVLMYLENFLKHI